MKQCFQAIAQCKFVIGILIAAAVSISVVKGCMDKSPPSSGGGVQLHKISGTENPERRGDVIFVHGLDGHYQTTWESGGTKPFFFPKELGVDFKDIGVWSIEYASSSSEWYGGWMPIEDRSLNLLEILRLNKIGDRPIIFVTHSLGGLMAKQMVVDSVDMKWENWENISENVKGVVFLATPHNGSSISNYLELLQEYFKGAKIRRTTGQVEQLKRNASMLRRLGNNYKRTAQALEIQTYAFFENENTGGAVRVVDQDSADPGMTNVLTIGIDADHGTICKPTNREHLVYKEVEDFITKYLQPPTKPIKIALDDFLKQFHAAKATGNDELKAFLDGHAGKSRVTWEAVVVQTFPAEGDNDPFLWIAPSLDSKEIVIARFKPSKYPAALAKNTRILFSGDVSPKSNRLGIQLTRCEMDELLE